MTNKRQCGQCNREFVAKRSDALYCSPRCRQQHFQDLLRSAPPQVFAGANTSPLVGQSPPSDRGLAETVESQLRAVGQLHTIDGQAAMGLAEHLSRNTISGSERVSLTKSLNEVMARVLVAAADNPDADPVHIIQQRAKARRDGDDQALAFWMARWESLPWSVRDPNPEHW